MIENLISKTAKDRIMRLVWPVVNNFGHLLKEDIYKHLNHVHLEYLIKSVMPGDVLLSVGKSFLSDIFIPGKAKHAAMVTRADGTSVYLVEATNSGVQSTGLYDFMEGKKKIYHVVPKFVSPQTQKVAVSIAKKYVGQEYDYLFSMSDARKYCSEVIFKAYEEAWVRRYQMSTEELRPFPLKPEERFGEKIYTPDDIRTDTTHWEVLWEN